MSVVSFETAGVIYGVLIVFGEVGEIVVLCLLKKINPKIDFDIAVSEYVPSIYY